MKIVRVLLLAVCSTTAALTQAQTVVPHTFQNGTPSDASEVNENFNALAESIDEAAVGRFVFKSAGEVVGFVLSQVEVISRQGYTSRYFDTRTGLIGEDRLFFQSSDCSGPDYSPMYPGAIFSSRSVLWAVPYNATYQLIAANSSIYGEGGCNVASVPFESRVTNVVPNDPAVTGFQNKGVPGDEYALPIIIEML